MECPEKPGLRCFALPCSVIGLDNSQHSLNQSEKKLKPTVKTSALQPIGLFLLWVLIGSYMYFLFSWLAVVSDFDLFGFGFTTLNPKLHML